MLKRGMSTRDEGNRAEAIAAYWLTTMGYEILRRNYQKPWGEIDIIASKDGEIVFFEVKANTKEGDNFDPEFRIDHRKLYKIVKTATLYLEFENRNLDKPWRVDAISVIFNEFLGTAKMKHFKNIAESHF